VQKEERARGEMMPTGRYDEAVEGATHSDERPVRRWLERNLEDEERGPVSHDERVDDTDQGAAAAPGSRDPVTDNLIQLPIGAEFQLGHEPSAQEREDLVRFAAAADAELSGHGADTDAGRRLEGERRHPEQDDDEQQ
jgi:hypothetical protein